MPDTATNTESIRRTDRADSAASALRSSESAARVRVSHRDSIGGLALFGIAVSLWGLWIAWRVTHLPLNAIAVPVLAIELLGALSTLVVVRALSSSRTHRSILSDREPVSHRYAHAIADAVGRTRSTDVRTDVVSAARFARSPAASSADRAMLAVLIDGPRRLAAVALVAVGLLVGRAPIPSPPLWAALCVGFAMLAATAAMWLLTGRRVRPGDRVCWSFAAMGETLSPAHVDEVAPRHWVGTVAAIVGLNVAIGLRGASDRWTHGLTPMSDDARLVTVGVALLLVVGALYTLRSLPPAPTTSVLVSRHLEERTARQAALAAAVAAGTIGLLAGVLPSGAETSIDPGGLEVVSESDLVDADG